MVKVSFVDTSTVSNAPLFSFLWVGGQSNFKLGFYGPAVIPCLIASLVSTVETVADITATYEASHLDTSTNSKEYEASLQGGLLSDAVNSVLAGLFTAMPNTTYSQNNGIIRVTKCASKRAGYACGIWLIIFGIIGKLGGLIASIPNAVLGGMTIYLFAQIFLSGLNLAATSLDLEDRRNKFILALSLAIGIGVSIFPYAFQDQNASLYTANFWKCTDCDSTLRGIRNGVSIFLSTGYCIGAAVAMLLNAILPANESTTAPKTLLPTTTAK